ncbi:hypothetical protein BDD12DRAFT_845003 [Trichophaea hybrida]|nr:hypothetical protein BDD12DRAFT_845003 [Trichophaea hybrida]
MRDMNCPEFLEWRSAKEEEYWVRGLEGTLEEMVVYDEKTGWYFDTYGWFNTLEEELEYKREIEEKYGDIMKIEEVAEWEPATELWENREEVKENPEQMWGGPEQVWGGPEQVWESENSEAELERELEQVQE